MSFLGKIKKALVGESATVENVEKNKEEKESSVENTKVTTQNSTVNHGSYKAIVVSKGAGGWGGPLTVLPSKEKPLIYSVTGGGIHPVAQKIADMTGGTPFDGFKSKANFDEIAVAVIDCGGTARVGVYPMKNVLTVDVHATNPAGPLMKFIKETNFVSGVEEKNINPA